MRLLGPILIVACATAARPAVAADDQAAMKAYREKIPGADVSFDMVPIPGGTFFMGSPATEKGHCKDESPQHEVRLAPFWMGRCAVTWDEYDLWGMGLDAQRRKLLAAPPAAADQRADAVARPTKPYGDMSFGMGKAGCPAVCMTQLAAKMYCRWLTAKTGHYYRLPTEAEWEYACRAGAKTAYSFGDDPKRLGDYAWYFGNSREKYHKVGQKKPNPWGLYDMHGNVAQWVLDQYAADGYRQFAGRTADNPLAPATTEYGRVVRGGSWDDDAEHLRSAARRASIKDWKAQDPQLPQSIWYLTDADFVGFRLVRPRKTPAPEEAKRYDLDDEQLREMKRYQEAHGGKE
jgi:formylglycine-generating enzyme required for sulfatase activity